LLLKDSLSEELSDSSNLARKLYGQSWHRSPYFWELSRSELI